MVYSEKNIICIIITVTTIITVILIIIIIIIIIQPVSAILQDLNISLLIEVNAEKCLNECLSSYFV